VRRFLYWLKRKENWLLLSIFLISALVRAIHFCEPSTTPFISRLAKEIAEGEWLGRREVFWQAPLYPYFLGALYILKGDIYFIKVVQLIMGSFSCIFLYLITKIVFNRFVALISSVALSIYPVMVWFELQLLPPVLSIFLNLLIVFCLLKRRFFISGLILGFSALSCQNILLFGLSTLFWLSLNKKPSTISFFLGILIPISLVTARNWGVGKELVMISTNGGINFFIGNNPEYERTTEIRPGRCWDRLVGEPDRILRRELTHSERDRYWYCKAFSFIKEDLLSYIKLLEKKFSLFWNHYEIRRNLPYHPFKENCSLFLNCLPIDFRVVGPLSILGMVLGIYRIRRYLLFYIFVTSYSASVILFFVTSRYRLPVIPFLIPFAVLGILYVLSSLKKRKHRAVILSFFLLLFFWTGYVSVDKGKDRGDFYALLGYCLEKQKSYADALIAYKGAISFNPEDTYSRCGIVGFTMDMGFMKSL
jgi:uncharacterized integral membrane protein